MALEEADELEGYRIGALMEELIEGMLPVGAGLAEDYGPGRVGEQLTCPVDALAVGFHVELLKVGGKAGKGFGVGEDSRLSHAEDIPLVDSDHRVEQGRVTRNILFLGELVGLVSAREEFGEGLGTEGEGKDHPPTALEDEYRPPMKSST